MTVLSKPPNNSKRDYPDIPSVPEALIRASSEGKLVVFVGAGVSRIVGCPSWKQFAYRVLQYLYDTKCINFHEFKNLRQLNLRKLLSICKHIIFEKELNPRPNFREMLTPKEELLKKYKIYENLYGWKAIYVTTNFDECLDKVARENKPPSLTLEAIELEKQTKIELEIPPKVIYSKEELLISNLDQGNILHLHGSIADETSLIITTSDYLKHYIAGAEPAVLLEKIFESHTVLFVGYGLEEYEILEYLVSNSKVSRIKGVLQHFMLYPMYNEEKNLFEFQKKYYADLGIELIPYPIGEYGYEHLNRVTEEWSKVIGPVAKPKDFYEKVKVIDEVI